MNVLHDIPIPEMLENIIYKFEDSALITLVAGTDTFYKLEEETPCKRTVPFANIKFHPKFAGYTYDIALIDVTPSFNDADCPRIDYIRIPRPGMSPNVHENMKMYVCGFGDPIVYNTNGPGDDSAFELSPTPNCGEMKIVGTMESLQDVEEDCNYYSITENSVYCVDSYDNTRENHFCYGDYGAPVFFEAPINRDDDKRRMMQICIASYSHPNTCTDYTQGCTMLDADDWICTTITDDEILCPELTT